MHPARALMAVMAAVVALGPMGPRGDVNAKEKGGVSTAAAVDPSALASDVRPWTSEEHARDRESFGMANAAEARGDYRAGEQPWRAALAIREATWGPLHPVTAIALNNLALNLGTQGRAAEAEPLLRRVLAIYEARIGADHPDTATSLVSLARGLAEQGRAAEAEPLFRRALAIWEARLGADHPDTLTALNNLGLLYQAAGRTPCGVRCRRNRGLRS